LLKQQPDAATQMIDAFAGDCGVAFRLLKQRALRVRLGAKRETTEPSNPD
jgi:hypothetical protein